MLGRLHGLVGGVTATRPLAVLRIIVGILALMKGFDVALRVVIAEPGPGNPWIAGVPDLITPVTVPVIVGSWFAASAALTLGWRSRIAAGTLAVLAGYLIVADLRVYNQHFYLLGVVCLVLAGSGAGGLLAIGQKRQLPTTPRWPATLLMLQMSIVYGYGALAKLDVDFVSGRVLFHNFVEQPVAGFLGGWLLDAMVLVPMALGVIATEAFLAVAAWWPRARWVVLATAGPLHVGMIVLLPSDPMTLLRLFIFGTLQLSLLLVLFAPTGPRHVLVWDDSCSFCSRWVTAFRRLDWLGLVDLVPLSEPARYAQLGITEGAALQALQLRDPGGAVHGGFEAVRRLAYLFPAVMLIAPWLALYPVRMLGARAYRRVAERRQCALPAVPAVAN